MKLGLISLDGSPRPVVATEGDQLAELDVPGDLLDLVRAGVDPRTLESRPLPPAGAPLPLRAPLRPGKIVAIGLNYLDHVRETGMEVPARPLVFAKFPTSVIGPQEPIEIDAGLTERVNGVTVQDSSTSEMVCGVAELLAYCSQSFTLEPGDVLLTGTPWG